MGLRDRLRNFDLPLLIANAVLALAGLVILYVTSLSGNTQAIFFRQLVFTGLGLVGFLLLALYNYHNLAKLNRWLYPVLCVLLVGLLLFARAIRGSARWIDFGFFRFQPAEIAKLVIILGLSRWLYLKRGQINSWRSLLLTCGYAAIPTLLIILQPDLGSAIILIFLWLGIVLVSSIEKKYILAVALAGVLLAGVGWKFVLKDYQRQRVEVFLNPSLDPRGRGYNARQAVIAVGSGQWFGRGLGRGLQSQLRFLPERQTDFVFASASEEIGFVGSLTLIGLYGFIAFRLIKIARRSRDELGRYIVQGVLFLIIFQAAINIGMNIGLVPVTGIPLPFISYGGSSLLVSFMALGLAQNVAQQSRALRF